MAARNNAALYGAVFAAQGRRFRHLPHAFVATDRPPPYYADITVSLPGHGAEVRAEAAALHRARGGSLCVKDSFCELDLAAQGFAPLFEAGWIWRAAARTDCPKGWERVVTPGALAEWEAAWAGAGSPAASRVFAPALLARPDTVVFAERAGDAIIGGCIATLSPDCIGLSNLFGPPDAPRFEAAIAALSALGLNLPLVGYESGDDLARAREAGFAEVGRLRVLAASDPRF